MPGHSAAKAKKNLAEKAFHIAQPATGLSLKNVKLPLLAAGMRLLKRLCI